MGKVLMVEKSSSSERFALRERRSEALSRGIPLRSRYWVSRSVQEREGCGGSRGCYIAWY